MGEGVTGRRPSPPCRLLWEAPFRTAWRELTGKEGSDSRQGCLGRRRGGGGAVKVSRASTPRQKHTNLPTGHGRPDRALPARPAATNTAPQRTAPTTARHCRGGRCNSLLRARRTTAAVEWNTATPVERMGIDVVGRATGVWQPQARPRHRERRRVAQGRAFARALQRGTALHGR